MNVKKLSSYAFILLFMTLTGCASTASMSSDNKDPLEQVNRKTWSFNKDYLDTYVLKPVTQAYVMHTPTFIRYGLYNMALNLNEPSTVINNILQTKFENAFESLGRFAINSTIGLLGTIDIAEKLGMSRAHEEFGEVLGKYGVGDGAYLMLPILGPSSVREGFGDIVDSQIWPLAIIDLWSNIFRMSIMGIERRAAIMDMEALMEEAYDPYAFVRNAYFQNMEFKLNDGNIDNAEDDVDQYLEGEYEDMDSLP